jgi:hypothetical protein
MGHGWLLSGSSFERWLRTDCSAIPKLRRSVRRGEEAGRYQRPVVGQILQAACGRLLICPGADQPRAVRGDPVKAREQDAGLDARQERVEFVIGRSRSRVRAQ